MSRALIRSLQSLQVYERQASQRCITSTIARDDVHQFLHQFPSKRLRLSPTAAQRTISSTSPCRASTMGKAIRPNAKTQMAPSMAVKMKEQQKKALAGGELPDDIGLLPQTVVMPSGSKRPSWLKDGSNRWRMEKARIKTRFYEFASAMAYRWFMVRPRPSLDYFKTTSIAKELHSEIYTHFAAGNLAPVEHKIADGLKSSLRGRLAQRAPNMSMKWTLHKYLSRPKLMSYKAALFPGPKGQSSSEANAVVQAVVRIHSQQSLQHVKKIPVRSAKNKTITREVITDASGTALNAAEMKPQMKDVVEYVVIQRSLRKSKERSWMMWGTTEELTMDRLKKDEKQADRNALEQLAGSGN